MVHNPFYSIVIPVYNVAPYLRECINSVLDQTFADWEAICVDDGSEDGSGAILDEYAAKDKRFRVIHKKNAGVGAARNAALDAAKGEWVLFLDGDDLWNGMLLSVVAGMIAKWPNEKLFRFSFERFDGERWHVKKKNCYAEGASYIDISQEISMRDFVFFFFFCYVYRKDLFDGIRFPRYIRGEDRCVLNRIQLERVDSIIATEYPLYGYRQRRGSAMHSIPSRQVMLDEMDHRLDMIEMIDASNKRVDYSNANWAVPYFLSFPRQIGYRFDSMLLWKEWLLRIKRLARAQLISKENLLLLRRRYKFPMRWWFMLGFIGRIALVPVRKFYRFVMRHGEFIKQ